MRFNGASGWGATVRPRHHNPPRVELTLGPLIFTLLPDEALALSDRLVDSVEAIRKHPNGKATNEQPPN